MKIVNVHEAKTHLSRLLESVSQGEEIILGKAGKPMAKIVPYSKMPDRVPGRCKGKIWMSDDFDKLPKEVEDSFYNSSL